jgi:hypothetical protein
LQTSVPGIAAAGIAIRRYSKPQPCPTVAVVDSARAIEQGGKFKSRIDGSAGSAQESPAGKTF